MAIYQGNGKVAENVTIVNGTTIDDSSKSSSSTWSSEKIVKSAFINDVVSSSENPDPNTTSLSQIRTKHDNCPTNDTWYIVNTIITDKQEKEETNNYLEKQQIAIRCSDSVIFTRLHGYQGEWSAWSQIPVIDDVNTDSGKTWSSEKINNDFVSNTVSLQMLVPDGNDVASYICNQKKTYLRYYTTTTSKVTNAPTDTANGYIWYCLDANLVITARNSKGEVWINPILNSNPTGWKKVCITPVKDISPTKLQLSVPSTQTLTNDQSSYCVVNGVCYLHIAVGWSNTAEMGWHLSSNADMPIPLNYFKSSIAIPEGFVHISVDETDEGGDLNIYCPKLNASRTLYMDFSYPVK